MLSDCMGLPVGLEVYMVAELGMIIETHRRFAVSVDSFCEIGVVRADGPDRVTDLDLGTDFGHSVFVRPF